MVYINISSLQLILTQTCWSYDFVYPYMIEIFEPSKTYSLWPFQIENPETSNLKTTYYKNNLLKSLIILLYFDRLHSIHEN